VTCAECGVVHSSGNEWDKATCSQCGWKATGKWAEHEGFHHWVATKHTWDLTVFKT
jgi:predicted  nucleic acid-binding Zn-ribbon protein